MRVWLSLLTLLLVALLASQGAARHEESTTNSNERRLGETASTGYASSRKTNNSYSREGAYGHNDNETSHGIGSNNYSRKQGRNGRYLMGGHSRLKRSGRSDDSRRRSKLGKRDDSVPCGERSGKKGDGNTLASDVLPTAPP
jgi:hypothetical protein